MKNVQSVHQAIHPYFWWAREAILRGARNFRWTVSHQEAEMVGLTKRFQVKAKSLSNKSPAGHSPTNAILKMVRRAFARHLKSSVISTEEERRSKRLRVRAKVSLEYLRKLSQ